MGHGYVGTFPLNYFLPADQESASIQQIVSVQLFNRKHNAEAHYQIFSVLLLFSFYQIGQGPRSSVL